MNLCRFFVPLIIANTAQAAPTEGVILLHGLCRTSASLKCMEKFLIQERYIVLNVDYPSRRYSIQQLADNVVQNAIDDSRFEKCRYIHFVTHSMGGILIRYYLAKKNPTKLGRVVMLAPPNQGSEVVDQLKDWWMFKKLNGPAGLELGIDSDSTPNKLGPVHFELGVLAGDRSVNWINSCWIKGADDGKVSVEKTKVAGMNAHQVVHTTHPFIMKNPEVLKYTASFLKNGTFSTP